MLVDLHNHTCHFSPDAVMSIDTLIEAAVARHLNAVGITEHYEYDNPDPDDDVGIFDIDKYTDSFKNWHSKCPSSLKLLMGIEFGYQTHTSADIDRIASSATFDVVILSNHLFRGRDVYYGGNNCYGLPKSIRHDEYINKMAEMCERCNNFDLAAHYDYINRYNPNPEERLLYEDCPTAFDRFFEALITKSKALEINTRSIYKLSVRSTKDIMPDEAIIKRYIAMGGKLITLGSDSHDTDTLGVYFEDTIEYLKTLGIKELCYYESRKPVLYGI